MGSFQCSKFGIYFVHLLHASIVKPFFLFAKYLELFNVKRIFHCDAKTLALGPCVGLDPQCVILR